MEITKMENMGGKKKKEVSSKKKGKKKNPNCAFKTGPNLGHPFVTQILAGSMC